MGLVLRTFLVGSAAKGMAKVSLDTVVHTVLVGLMIDKVR